MKTLSLSLKYLFLGLLVFISVFPFVWMVLGMTNQTFDIVAGKIMIGDQLVINFQNLFASELNFTRALGNSAVIAVITTVFALLFSSMAGYGFEIYRTKTKRSHFQYFTLIDDGSFCGFDDSVIPHV